MAWRALSLLFVALLTGHAADKFPDVQAIIARSVRANDADWKADPHYDYTERDRTGVSSATFRVTMMLGTPYSRRILQDGKPLPPDQAREERQKYERALAQRKCQSDCSRLTFIESTHAGRSELSVWRFVDVEPDQRSGDPFAHGVLSVGVGQLRLHGRWQDHSFKQSRKQIDATDEHKVVNRPGIGNDEPHRLESQLLQSVAVLLKIFHGVVFIHAMGSQELVEPVPGSEAEQPPQVGPADATALEFLERQGFEGAAREVVAGCTHATGHFVGNLNGEIHALSLSIVKPVAGPRPLHALMVVTPGEPAHLEVPTE